MGGKVKFCIWCDLQEFVYDDYYNEWHCGSCGRCEDQLRQDEQDLQPLLGALGHSNIKQSVKLIASKAQEGR